MRYCAFTEMHIAIHAEMLQCYSYHPETVDRLAVVRVVQFLVVTRFVNNNVNCNLL